MNEYPSTPPALEPERSELNLFRPWRVLAGISRRRWLYFPRILSPREKKIFGAVSAFTAIAVITFLVRLVFQFTVPAPAVGGVLREGEVAQPHFINPIYASSPTDRDITNVVFGKLIRYDGKGEVTMDLASSVDVSEDGKIYSVPLKHDVVWHDGEPFSADDVVFTVRTIQDPEYKSPLRANWQGVTVEKADAHLVRFTLRQPYAPFMENLSLGIIPEHLWGKISRDTAPLSDLNLKPIGTGPYQFQKLAKRDDGTITSLTLTRNRDFHLEGPYLSEMQFLFYSSEEAMAGAYRRNDIDGLMIQSQATADLMVGLDAELHDVQQPKLFAVFLNAGTNAALGRAKVKSALSLAVNRQQIIDDALASGATLVASAIPPGTFGYNGDITEPSFDLEQAKSLLTADGWKANKDGVLERTEGSGKNKATKQLKITLATSDAQDLSRAADKIAEAWRVLGVVVDVVKIPSNELQNTMIRPRNYEALLFGEVFGHDPDPYAFWHASQLKDPGLNIALYANSKVDKLLEDARRTNDAEARKTAYRQFQEIVATDIGAIFLWSPTDYYAIRKTFRGVEVGSLALPEERFNQTHEWFMNTRRLFK